ncbi:serine hydrolase domain-containing protein [Sphingosinicella soli]|uniref:CubicO group peptidase (Beta-lactamase class C family) n=1 Tax=Sphingosinicella soli TaxID=333708 RepID=A0A7W7B4W1_9SPHN|nr:serine hydrolase domain-containing protein [Sphingosinicella soli]MBB4633150.1 CubicO group peptidase (beta-lactamase class C family) [Sphingosinicella soli]
MRLWAAILMLFAMVATTTVAAAEKRSDEASVAQWADPLFARALAERRLSGAVLSVSSGGETVFARGYGWADAASTRTFNAERTRVRIGSATKTFGAVAIAQLIERGLIGSLDDPANLYLRRIKLPEYEGREITIRELATHRGGFANRTFGIASDAPYTPMLSPDALRQQAVPIVRKPGARAVYSNYSTAILGIIVEDLTNVPIAEFMRANIFEPLGMANTEMAYGGTPPRGLGKPYGYLPNGTAQPVTFMGIHPFFAPVGAIVSTAPDMTRYMNALLAGARGEATPLGLSPARFAELLDRHAGNHPAVLGFGTVFMTLDWGSTRGIGHGGDWPGFHSIFWIFPEQNVGLFFSLMAEMPSVDPVASLFSGGGAPDPDRPVEMPLSNIGVFSSFMQHFHGDGVPLAGKAETAIPVADLAGSYRHEYRAYGTIMEFLDLLNAADAVMRVEPVEGGLMIGGKGPYRAVAPNVYWHAQSAPSVSGGFTASPVWAFSRDPADGSISLNPRFAIDPFVRVGLLQNPATHAAMLPVLLLSGVSGFAALFWRARRMVAGRTTRIAAVLSAVIVVLIGLALLTFWTGRPLIEDFLLGLEARFLALAGLGTLLAAACAVLLYGFVRNLVALATRRQPFLIFEHLHLLLLSLCAIGWIALLAMFNMIGFRL